MIVLVTGAAGFIGFHLSLRLLRSGINVIGFDNLNTYYDPDLKRARLNALMSESKVLNVSFDFVKGSLESKEQLDSVFQSYSPSIVVNLAAQAGVRYSLENPDAYIQSNIVGFANILECCRNYRVEHLLYASSSSVYGGNSKLPFCETDSVSHPVSLYAATKKSNELMAHSYSHLYGFPSTGLRFFTVYGPWGRPDMALFKFTKSIIANEPIQIYNNGQMVRDFTYIDDVVESLMRLLPLPAPSESQFNTTDPDASRSWAPYQIFNIGNSNPTPLLDYICAIESALGIKAIKQMLPLQPGDVPSTGSDCSSLEQLIDFKPQTSIEEGVSHFVKWYLEFYSK